MTNMHDVKWIAHPKMKIIYSPCSTPVWVSLLLSIKQYILKNVVTKPYYWSQWPPATFTSILWNISFSDQQKKEAHKCLNYLFRLILRLFILKVCNSNGQTLNMTFKCINLTFRVNVLYPTALENGLVLFSSVMLIIVLLIISLH